MKVIIYRDKETKRIVRGAGDDYELLKARGKTDEDIAALVEEFNGRENKKLKAENAALRERLKKAVEDVAERSKMAFYYEFVRRTYPVHNGGQDRRNRQGGDQ